MAEERPNWWHIAKTPNGWRLDELEPAAGDDVDAVMANGMRAAELRAELGFPDDWPSTADWDSSLTEGEPHRVQFERPNVVVNRRES